MLAVGLIETGLVLAHYLDTNDSIEPSTAITVLGLIFGVTKRSLSRVLVLMVSQGYGVVRSSLGDDMRRILYLGGGYGILSLVYSLAQSVPSNSHIVGDPEYVDLISVIIFMLSVVDLIFYIWILHSLSVIIVSLRGRGQIAKVTLFERFRIVLYSSAFLSICWELYAAWALIGGRFEWEMKWSIDALWELSYFAVFTAIALLWAPSRSSDQFGYIALAQLDKDEETTNDGIVEKSAGTVGFHDDPLDAEYGGRLDHDELLNPFAGSGALDVSGALSKRA